MKSGEQAVSLFQRALAIREQVLGLAHPDTLKLREDYTELLATMQQPQTVIPGQEAMPRIGMEIDEA